MRGVQSLVEPGARADGRFPAIKAPTELLDLLAGKSATDAWAAYQEPLTEKDLPAMMALQAEMAAALPSPRWYFTSKEEEFAQEVRAGRVLGLRVNGELAAFAIACPARDNAKSYAAILGGTSRTAWISRTSLFPPATAAGACTATSWPCTNSRRGERA